MAAPRGHDQGGSQRELKVEDALLYLDEVKKEFQYKPAIYNEFLDIMKNFKALTIDTPGVIKKVSDLFRGYRRLILGFNTFLPEGHKINNEDIERSENEYRLAEEARMMQMGTHPSQQVAGGGAGGALRGVMPQGGGGGAYPNQQQLPQQQQLAQQQQGQQGGAGGQQAAGGAAHQPQEFDHAISYVTNIKQRFANQPDTYKAFLDILHDYQRDQSKPKEQQKGIQEVLDKVSKLFAEHPDLLKEFTYFLPDAVQGQAKERLDRAAHESYQRQQMRQQLARNREMQQARRGGGGRGRGGGQDDPYRRGGGGGRGGGRGGAYRRDEDEDEEDFGGKRGRGGGGMGGGGGTRGSGGKKLRTSGLEGLQATSVERFFFEKVKEALGGNGSGAGGGGGGWSEFVHSLHLYNSGVLEQADLLTLVGELLAAGSGSGDSAAGAGAAASSTEDLFDEFKVILSFHSTAQFANQMWAQLPLSELDLSQCRRCTPSYRALPQSYPKLTCSKRSELEKQNLNDGWVGVPMGSEEQFVFKHMRKNQFEEELFKCEDQRFEVDMVVEANRSTLNKLQPMVEEIQKMKDQADAGGAPLSRYRFRMDERNLSTLHLAAVARVYGEHAEDILRLLKQHPVGAIPVIHRRLVQKDVEWRRARQEKVREWRPLVEANFVRALDHRRDAFKAKDKRLSAPHFLVSESLDAALAQIVKAGGEKGKAAAALLPDIDSGGGSGGAGAAASSAASLSATTNEKENPSEVAAKMALVNGLQDLDGPGNDDGKAFLKCAPHQVFDIGDVLLQWEMFKLIKLALPRSAVSLTDTQRILSLWREVVIDFLGLPFAMLDSASSSAAAAAAAAAAAGGSTGDVDDSPQSPLSVEDALAPGTSCVCPAGPATVESYNPETSTYSVVVQQEEETSGGGGSKAVSFHARTVWPLAFPAPSSPPAPFEPERRGKSRGGNGASGTAPSSSSASSSAPSGSGAEAATATTVASASDESSTTGAAAEGGEKPSTPPPSTAAAEDSSDYPEPTSPGPLLPSSSRTLLLTTPGFLFFRLYALLYERLVVARATVEAAAEAALVAEEHPLKDDVREEQADIEKRALDALSVPLPPSSSSDKASAAAAATTAAEAPSASTAVAGAKAEDSSSTSAAMTDDDTATTAAPSAASSNDGDSESTSGAGGDAAEGASSSSPTAAAGGSIPHGAAVDAETKALVKGGFRGFLGLLGSLLSGNIDAGKYDDVCRAMCGSEGYLMSTLEKNVMAVVKALQGLVHDKACPSLVGLYQWERAREGGLAPKRYLMHTKHMLQASPSEVYRVQVDLSDAPEGGERSRTLSLDMLGSAATDRAAHAAAATAAAAAAPVVPTAVEAAPAAAALSAPAVDETATTTPAPVVSAAPALASPLSEAAPESSVDSAAVAVSATGMGSDQDGAAMNDDRQES